MNFYTADPHFFHENILKFCKRPFQTVDAMNGHILYNCQSTVGPTDDLWILGDLAVCHINMADQLSEMLSSIPGRKHLIVGNHDKPWIRRLKEWSSVHDLLEINDLGSRTVLCHYPMVTWPGARHGSIQLFGHVHQNFPGTRNCVNIGVDQWDFRPVTLQEAKMRAAGLEVNPLWPQVEPGAEI